LDAAPLEMLWLHNVVVSRALERDCVGIAVSDIHVMA
jgi:hypothetical protein